MWALLDNNQNATRQHFRPKSRDSLLFQTFFFFFFLFWIWITWPKRKERQKGWRRSLSPHHLIQIQLLACGGIVESFSMFLISSTIMKWIAKMPRMASRVETIATNYILPTNGLYLRLLDNGLRLFINTDGYKSRKKDSPPENTKKKNQINLKGPLEIISLSLFCQFRELNQSRVWYRSEEKQKKKRGPRNNQQYRQWVSQRLWMYNYL